MKTTFTLTLLCSILFTGVARSEVTMYMSIENQDGPIEGDTEAGSHTLISYDQTLSVPYNQSTGKVTGNVNHMPFTVVKHINQGSPFFMKTCAEGQTCPKVQIDICLTDDAGSESVYYTICLENARIIKVEFELLNNPIEFFTDKWAPIEKIQFVYQQITWTHAPTGCEYTEDTII